MNTLNNNFVPISLVIQVNGILCEIYKLPQVSERQINLRVFYLLRKSVQLN